ncbi:hypothetical protein TVAG_393460 [Trichomonas vaginalis G3]|uniref:Uncharacterized protein n=1 Tax=Trichomonas vaginalis (strain ATCC PRA-98 / G3) TaxID=412133 RepID=A2DYE1_TRIV3|nr:protein ubiquitination [Trichomonas vaginalis G3]EAY14618.1 hypothetical protein TVAG_393460 [Trichomonas vaginalis G3]KAI5526628.1 protein ubiquitination [Trichomonas vaginalis G3]|eukprot:XP_001326841.1 hypothetical protein [Trichomonas vaginalis G3]
MSGGLTIDFDYIANNIQSYIDQRNFYDIIDENDIPTVLEKTNLNPNDFQTLLSQGKTKYNSSKIYGFVRKCNVSVNSFEDVINVLDSYKSILKLKSSGNLIDYLNQYKTDFNTLENENNKFKEEINQLKNEIATLNNKNNEQLQNEVSTLLKQNAQLMDDIFKCHNENNK